MADEAVLQSGAIDDDIGSENIIKTYEPTLQEMAIAERVVTDFGVFKRALEEKRKNWIDFFEHYYNIRQHKRRAGEANTPVPLAPETIDTVWADIMGKLFSPDGLRVDTLGREQLDQGQAKSIAEMIRYQVYEDGIKEKFGDSLLTCLITGGSPFKTCYTERWETLPVPQPVIDPLTGQQIATQTIPQETLVYKGPTMIPIDIFDFFPHPQMVDINDDLPAIHRFYATKNHLEDMERQGLYRNVEFIDWKHEGKLAEPELDERKKERRHLAGVRETQLEKDAVECYEWQGMYDIDRTGERKNCILVVTADNIVLRAEELPYYDKKKTYGFMRIFPIQGEFWGIGLIEKQHAMIHGANSLMNAILDSLYQNVNPPTLIADNAFLDESELVNRSGQFVHVDKTLGENLQTDFIYRMQPEMIAPDAYNVLAMMKQYAQSASSAQAPTTGDLPASKQTATAVSTAFGQSQVRFKAILAMVENSGLLPLCDRMQRINQQFIDAPYAIRVIGANGAYWKQISPADIAGRVNFISYGSSREADKAMNVQQLLTAINIAGGQQMLQSVVPILFMEYAEESNFAQLEMIKMAMQWDQQRMMFLQQLQMQAQQIQTMQAQLPQQPEAQSSVQPQNMMQPTSQENLIKSVREATRVQPGEGIAVQ